MVLGLSPAKPADARVTVASVSVPSGNAGGGGKRLRCLTAVDGLRGRSEALRGRRDIDICLEEVAVTRLPCAALLQRIRQEGISDMAS